MSSHPDVTDTALSPQVPAPQLVSVGWALRRTALWLAMMFVMVVVGAWLFYASIDPDEATAGPATSAELTKTPQ